MKPFNFVPPPPEVGKPGSSVLIFHDAIYQGFIVRFTLLEEVFPSLFCAYAKSELSNHSVSLGTQAPMRVVESTFNQGSKTPGTSPFSVLPSVCKTLQELRHVPHRLVYWSHSHLPTLSYLVSVDNNASHIFSFSCLRLVSNGCYCFVSVTGLGGSTLLSVSICSFFCLVSSFFDFLINSPIAVAQIFLSHSLPAWRPRVGVKLLIVDNIFS